MLTWFTHPFADLVPLTPLPHTSTVLLNHLSPSVRATLYWKDLSLQTYQTITYSITKQTSLCREKGPSLPSGDSFTFSFPLSQKSLISHKLVPSLDTALWLFWNSHITVESFQLQKIFSDKSFSTEKESLMLHIMAGEFFWWAFYLTQNKRSLCCWGLFWWQQFFCLTVWGSVLYLQLVQCFISFNFAMMKDHRKWWGNTGKIILLENVVNYIF